MAIDINDTRGLHVGQLTRDALRNMGKPIAAADVLVLGAAYREDVGDTRYSGSEIVIRKLAEMGAEIGCMTPMLSTGGSLNSRILTLPKDRARRSSSATRRS